ncbi:ATP-binding protein [Sphingobium ummariense]
MTAIDHSFAPDRPSGGFLARLFGWPRRGAAERRAIPVQPPLLLEEAAQPGFHRSEPEAGDEAPRPLAMGMMAVPLRPISLRRDSIYNAFNTAMPVTDRHGLTGRNQELERLVEAIVVQRRHAIIFGTRGSGKTSLARVFGDLADEAGCVALYGSASGDSDFDSLFRPFLAELPMSAAGKDRIKALADGPLDVARLASLLVEEVRQRSILIIDEYDRLLSEATKQEVATLLKLLTDIHSPVQVVLVGIAGDVDGLIAAHPSLRRHLAPQRVSPIPKPELERLLLSCGENAGLAIDPDALDALAGAAMGSPYHARLFGMQAALVAEAAGRDRLTAGDAERGLTSALEDWAEMSVATHAWFARLLADADADRRMVALAGIVASQMSAVSVDRLALAATEIWNEASSLEERARNAIARLQPVLVATPAGDHWMFEDTLAPQFLLLMAKRPARSVAPAPTPAAEMRAMMRGVDGL